MAKITCTLRSCFIVASTFSTIVDKATNVLPKANSNMFWLTNKCIVERLSCIRIGVAERKMFVLTKQKMFCRTICCFVALSSPNVQMFVLTKQKMFCQTIVVYSFCVVARFVVLAFCRLRTHKCSLLTFDGDKTCCRHRT